MTQRDLSDSDWREVVRLIEVSQHFMRAMPREPEMEDSIQRQIKELDQALLLLGKPPRAADAEP